MTHLDLTDSGFLCKLHSAHIFSSSNELKYISVPLPIERDTFWDLQTFKCGYFAEEEKKKLVVMLKAVASMSLNSEPVCLCLCASASVCVLCTDVEVKTSPQLYSSTPGSFRGDAVWSMFCSSVIRTNGYIKRRDWGGVKPAHETMVGKSADGVRFAAPICSLIVCHIYTQ